MSENKYEEIKNWLLNRWPIALIAILVVGYLAISNVIEATDKNSKTLGCQRHELANDKRPDTTSNANTVSPNITVSPVITVSPEIHISTSSPSTGTSKAEKKSFKLINSIPVLTDEIERSTVYGHLTSSKKNIVVIETNGRIEELDTEGLYWFSGGFVRVTVDSSECEIEQDFYIERTLPAGNSIAFVDHYVRDEISRIIEENLDLFTAKIGTCLN